LTAYVQLVVLRLNAQRALISLFDSQYQHVVTEATSSVPLTPCMASQDMDARELWLCGTAVPRSVGVCSKILIDGDLGTDLTVDGTSNSPTDLPVITIADMTADERTAGTLYCNGWPDNRFYAGVPIRTHRGIDIGFLCVLDDAPREGLDEISVRLMQDVSSLIMLRFEARRSAESYQRADRMVRGLGSFVEGQATIMTGWQEERNQSSHVPTGEGEPNQNQQQLRADQEHEEVPRLQEVQDPPASHLDDDPVAQEDAPRPAVHFHDHSQPTGLTTTVAAGTTKTPERGSHEAAPVSIDHVFARAANIVRESVEVEGVLFLDASIRSFGGLATAKAGPHHRSSSSSSSSSSEEEKAVSPPLQSSDDESPDDVMCDILGFSTSSASSVDGTAEQYSHTKVPQKLLSRLLRRYPQGKVFNFDDGGTIHTSDFSSDELLSLGAAESILSFMPELSATQPQQPPRQSKRQSAKRRFARQNEGKLISDMFTGARSVILVPVWDNQRERWFAGGFVYTKTPTRVFTVDGELSYLRAFASVIMSEVARVKAISVDRAKTDLLSSMSHELRSPLHGVVLGVELLQDTPLDAFQGDVLHSVETCGRTLLDTMDHLLDWSKINNFVKSSKQRSSRIEQSGSPRARRHSIEAGMMSITSDMDVAVLIEEVVESICAGFNFQQFSLAQLGGTKSPGQKQPEGLQRLDTMQAVENIFTGKNKAGILNIVLGDVVVGLDIDPEPSWIFRSQPGAIRRIVMNILGNSLKYTSKGFIKVSLAQSALLQKGSTRTVELTVVDSGQGISDDYLQNHLFTPFSQENSLAAGAGLGLSIVKRIATSLGGSLQVQSKVGQGTTVRVRLPLKATPTPPPGAAPESDYADEFDAQVTELQGLRVRLMSSQATLDRKESLNVRFSQQETFARICRDWLRLHIIESGQEKEMLPDFVLCDEVTMKHAFAARRGNASIPIVVVCSDTLVARRLATSPAFNSTKVGVVEFVTQP
jgi:signal transduction histidine kinase